ncbi:hypothetical protein A3C87_01265 [Candidatus Kaiserbacteria bacterium RIFCSPHIGHO2_02_FULL_49_34]|uniref:Uncharacterized protein n=1 Tax=Candidatus Kaiserbacteria bacterium RIFCSPHIGHO2_02_FULL_49_34 TaxID=1798491 RepID=A0A1F6DME1_9BACT|nr:MAG: hypothetical protein A3C87_01265 [Candidatus Kaiserbacteria bacterium RIFCSPHIGHO2_02_FULL_49_34]
MKYIKYIFYGTMAILAVFLIGKKDAGSLVSDEERQSFFGPESAYADTQTRTYNVTTGDDGDDGGN